jgi:hypothetical protein
VKHRKRERLVAGDQHSFGFRIKSRHCYPFLLQLKIISEDSGSH